MENLPETPYDPYEHGKVELKMILIKISCAAMVRMSLAWRQYSMTGGLSYYKSLFGFQVIHLFYSTTQKNYCVTRCIVQRLVDPALSKMKANCCILYNK